MNLKDQITHAELNLFRFKQRVREQEGLITELKSLRASCTHTFTDAVPGYEHEGGTCIHCGINELEAVKPRTRFKFSNVFCSQCGSEFGPGDHGFSSCKEHQGNRAIG